jgi:hypothetical protein
MQMVLEQETFCILPNKLPIFRQFFRMNEFALKRVKDKNLPQNQEKYKFCAFVRLWHPDTSGLYWAHDFLHHT